MNQKAKRVIVTRDFILELISLGVLANGLIIISTALMGALSRRTENHLSSVIVSLPVLIGLSLVYLATHLRRRKRTAWTVTIPLYAFVFGSNITQTIFLISEQRLDLYFIIRNIVLPILVVTGLLVYHREFTVKSDIQSFAVSLQVISLILLVTILYGVLGFEIMDTRDFHQEISVSSAIHNTVDQFGLTTNKQLTPYTHRAKLFLDSLNAISIGAAIYITASLFQPLRARFSDQATNRKLAEQLILKYPEESEDYFKLWPHDKLYFFTPRYTAGLAYHVTQGVALVVGDPFGNPRSFSLLLENFLELCRVNDWLPAFVHTHSKFNKIYKQHGFSLQKIGEEAVVNTEHFNSSVLGQKYFHQIENKFQKQNYSTEILYPPHNKAIISRLKEISDDWLKLPGRTERGFMMGYFTEQYMQLCTILVARDAAGTIQAFLNQLPTYQSIETSYDLLRHSKNALGNINDFILIEFNKYAHTKGYTMLNLGLCPLAGLSDKKDENKTVVDSALQFVYANGDRFYSFSGLYKFKSKYEPIWSDRFIAYRGGLKNFTRTLTALNRTMNKSPESKHYLH